MVLPSLVRCAASQSTGLHTCAPPPSQTPRLCRNGCCLRCRAAVSYSLTPAASSSFSRVRVSFSRQCERVASDVSCADCASLEAYHGLAERRCPWCHSPSPPSSPSYWTVVSTTQATDLDTASIRIAATSGFNALRYWRRWPLSKGTGLRYTAASPEQIRLHISMATDAACCCTSPPHPVQRQ